MTSPPDLTAPENDYRSLEPTPGGDDPAVSVVIPAHGRIETVRKTLAGLTPQLTPADEVVVVDDGSDPPLAGLGERVTIIPQPRDGFGAGRARNRGWTSSSNDVVVFLDSDSIPARDFLARHRAWHAAAANLVVVGLRHHVDASGADAGTIATTGPESLPRIEEDAGAAPDWRQWLVRRSAALTLGDQAFRAGLTNNLSVRRERLEEVGGFDEAFSGWGGEDTELTWRLWNAGAFIVPERLAPVYHQIEPGELRHWRQDVRRLNLTLISDRIPHRFYRPRPHPFATVPKLTWVVAAETPEEFDDAWKRMAVVPFGDSELIWVTSAEDNPYAALHGHSRRVRVVERVADAVLAASGEVICFVDARVQFTPGVAGKAVERLDADPRAAAVRVPYVLGGDRYRRLDELAAVDAALGRDGAPLFALVRRRELAKDRAALADPARMWPETLDRCRVAFLPGDGIRAPLDGLTSPGVPGASELAAAGPRELTRLVVSRTRRRLAGEPEPTPDTAGGDRVVVDYVGFTEHDNLGDDAIQVAMSRLMPWADLGRDRDDADCLMLGGGTLINANRYYLTRILRRDTPTTERAVFGVGVRDPAFHGTTEPMEEWWRFFDSSLYVGVRGPASIDHLRRLGYRGGVEVLGDPALSLAAPEVEVDDDGVVVCPVWTSGNLLGGDDRAVFDALAGLVSSLVSEGRNVTMMSAFPYDDRHILELMRRAGHPDLEYVAGYADVDLAMETLAGAGIVVAERLHAAIMAAAAHRPFVALEYWPKHRDFARSLDVEELVVPTAGLDATLLQARFADLDARRDELTERLTAGVEGFRKLQRDTAERLRAELTARSGERGVTG